MREFYGFMLAALAAAWFCQYTRFSFDGKVIGRRDSNSIAEFALFAILTLFIGLRRYYNDTGTYKAGYDDLAPLAEYLEHFDFSLGDHVGFELVNAWLKSLDVSTQGFLLFYAAISVGLSLYFIKKHSCNFLVSVFLFFTTNMYFMPAAAMKQYVAVIIGMLSIPCVVKKQWLRFLLLVGIATLFHPYALMYLLFPLLQFRPWSARTYLLLFVTVIIGFSLESLFSTIIDITSLIGKGYTEEDLVGEGINLLRVLVCNVPLILSFLFRGHLFRDSTKEENLMINLAMINGAIMFVGLFGTAIYFSRLANYFTITQCIVLPWLISRLPMNRRDKRLVTVCMVVGYMGFFLYANKSFDSGFSRITLLEYLLNHVFHNI